jgi:SWI/SNF-related matrix-associated actin-dependent regulator of chromatin subfamily A-like protein 1
MIKIKPLDHQIAGIKKIEQCGGRCLLADEMGLGKTIQALGVLYRNPDWFPALILCPAAVKYLWEAEALKFRIAASVCEGHQPPDASMVPPYSSQLMIINYDILDRWMKYLKTLDINTVVLDESQYLSNRTTNRTVSARTISRKAKHVIALSGTPIINRPVDLFPVVNMVWPKEFSSFWSYAIKYCNPKTTPFGWDFSGSSNLGELHARLIRLGMIRRRKSIMKLPDKTRLIISVAVPKIHEYQKALDDFLMWVRKQDPSRVLRSRRSDGLVKVGHLIRLAARLKMDSSIGIIKNYLLDNPKKKLVVMAVHKPIIKRIINTIGVKCVVIDGSVTGRIRQAAVDQFQNDSKTRLSVCNIKAAGTGITLTAADRLDFVELWWNPGTHLQAEDRIHRIGQKNAVRIYYHVGRHTIEEKVCRIIQAKQEIITKAIDGKQEQDFNVYQDLLTDIVERGV